jgi:hypothetical protein
MLRGILLALACGVGGGCGGSTEQAGSGTPKPEDPQPEDPQPEAPDGPIPCNSDEDCPTLACGPCGPGEVVMRHDVEIDCFQNPCDGDRSVCGPDHVCVVGPDTKRSPAVWCRGCYDLGAKVASICGDKADAEATAACENALAEAIESCDDDRCEAARRKQLRPVPAPVEEEEEEQEQEPDGDAPAADGPLSRAEVTKGFMRAYSEVRACPGAVPGMKIKVIATINGNGLVLSATPAGPNAELPVFRCVAAAVKARARFAKSTRGLDSKSYTYNL